MTPGERLGRYRKGWVAGAGVRTVEDIKEADYSRGWADGRKALRSAMDAERKRLGLPPAAVLRSYGIDYLDY